MTNLGFLTLGDDSQKRPDFSKMSETDLRAYVLAHRKDQSAFYAYVDRKRERPPIAVIEAEEWSEERMQEATDGAKGRS